MTFKIFRAARLGAMLRKMSISGTKIRSHGKKHLSIYRHFPRCAQLGAMLRYLERNVLGAIVMKISIFEE